jgi:flagellar basal-body rod protein FlgF
MLRGLYTATAGMLMEQRKHDTITNNISNINTPGFKQGNAVSRSFPEFMISLANGSGDQRSTFPIGKLNTGVFAEEDLSIYVQGDLQETKNPLDLALQSNIQVPGLQFDGSGKAITADGRKIFQPQAFFTVLDQNGEQRYSRNGKFQVNDLGEVTTPEGYKVLGRDGQPIVLVDPTTNTFLANVKIRPDGQFLDEVYGKPLVSATGQPLTLMISRVNDPNRLIREGNGVYKINAEDAGSVTSIVPNNEVQIHQGYIERSNVDAAQSMIDMTAALRAYEANQKIVQYYDKSLEKTVNEVGRV